MFNVPHIRNNRYSSSLLCFIIVCILVVCTANERAEFEKLSFAASNNIGSITSPENAFESVNSFL